MYAYPLVDTNSDPSTSLGVPESIYDRPDQIQRTRTDSHLMQYIVGGTIAEEKGTHLFGWGFFSIRTVLRFRGGSNGDDLRSVGEGSFLRCRRGSSGFR